MISVGSALRAVGVFLGNLLTAMLTTAILTTEASSIFNPKPDRMLLFDDCFSAIVSFGLGYFIYRKWRFASAKFVWIVGACLFGLRATHVVIGYHGTLFAEVFGRVSDIPNVEDWSSFTIPLVRTSFYSIGAFSCSRIASLRRSF
jgi:hypothetical protein